MKQLIALYDAAEEGDITIDCFDLSENESMSLMDDGGGCHIAIDPEYLNTEHEELIRLAHELGHCITGSFYNIYTPFDIREKHETRANRWAYRKLIPVDELYMAIDRGYREFWELAEYFDVPGEFQRASIDDAGRNDARTRRRYCDDSKIVFPA